MSILICSNFFNPFFPVYTCLVYRFDVDKVRAVKKKCPLIYDFYEKSWELIGNETAPQHQKSLPWEKPNLFSITKLGTAPVPTRNRRAAWKWASPGKRFGWRNFLSREYGKVEFGRSLFTRVVFTLFFNTVIKDFQYINFHGQCLFFLFKFEVGFHQL